MTPSYASRILTLISDCVALTPASWTQWMTDLTDGTEQSALLWHRLADRAGVELRSDVKRTVIAHVSAEAEQEFAAALHNARDAHRRLAEQAAR